MADRVRQRVRVSRPRAPVLNDQARDTLDPGGQAALLAHAAEALTGAHPAQLDVELPTGAKARMNCRPLGGKGRRRLVSGVVHVKLIEPASQVAVDGGAEARLCGGRGHGGYGR